MRLGKQDKMAEPFDLHYNRSDSPEPALKKAISDKKESIASLRRLIASRPDIDFFRQDDEYLLRFLYARKHDVQAAFELLVNYVLYQQRNPEIFTRLSVDDDDIKQALKDGFPGVLHNRDRKGRCVLLMFASHWDHCLYSFFTIYRSMLLSLEKLIEKVHNQACGFVVIVDWTNFTFRQSSNLSPRLLKSIIEGLQDCFPARFKAVHFINQPWYVETVLRVIKPFLKEKTSKRIFSHGNNLSRFHEALPVDILPAELGGEGPSYNPLLWANSLIESGFSINHNPCNLDKIQNLRVNDSCQSISRISETYEFDDLSVDYNDDDDDEKEEDENNGKKSTVPSRRLSMDVHT